VGRYDCGLRTSNEGDFDYRCAQAAEGFARKRLPAWCRARVRQESGCRGEGVFFSLGFMDQVVRS